MEKNKDLYTLYGNEYRGSYFKGLKGLSSKAREAFETQYSSLLKKDDNSYNDEIFRSLTLKNVLENHPEPTLASVWNDRATQLNTPEKRNKLWSQLSLMEDLDEKSDTADSSAGFWDFFSNSLVADARENAYALETFNPGSKGAKAFSEMTDALEDNLVAKKLKLDESTTIRNQSRQYLQNQADILRPYLSEQYNNSPETTKQAARKHLAEMSKFLSPNYYVRFKNDQFLSPEFYDSLIMEYMAWEEAGGQIFANEKLTNFWQDYFATQQTQGEKWANASAKFGKEVVSTGIMAAGLVKGLLGNPGEENPEGYWQGIIDNEWTRYAADLFTTGQWSREEQKEYKAKGWDADAILNTVEQERSLLSANTPAELFAQYGFTAASMLLSGGLSGLAKAGFKGIAKLGFKAGFNSISKGRQFLKAVKGAERFTQMMIPTMVAGPEAALEAITTRDESLQHGKDNIDKIINSNIDKDILDYVNEFPDIAELLLREDGTLDDLNLSFGHLENIGETGKSKKVYSDLDKQRLYNLVKNHPNLREAFGDKYSAHKNEMLEQLKNSESRTLWTTFGLNMAVLGAINSTLQATQQALGVRRALGKGGANRFANAVDLVQTSPNKWKAMAKNVTKWNMFTDRLKEALGEGMEEMAQGTISAFSTGMADNKVLQYFNARYNTAEPLDAFAEDTWQMVGAGLLNGGQALVSRETFKEGLYGTLSTLLGGPSVNFNVSFGKKREGESTYDMIMRNSLISLRGIYDVAFSSAERNAKQKENEDIANTINAFLDNDNYRDIVFDIISNNQSMKAFTDSTLSGDEKAARDAKVDALFSTVSMLSSMKGTGYYDLAIETLEGRSRYSARNLQDENSNESLAVEEFRVKTGSTESKEAILQEIKDSAQSFLDLMKSAEKNATEVRKIYGDNISLDVQKALVSNRLHIEDRERRIKQLTEEHRQIDFTEENSATPNSIHSKSIKQGFARYGSYKQAQSQRQALKQEIEENKKTIANLESEKANKSMPEGLIQQAIDFYKTQIKRAEESISVLDGYLTELKNLSEEERENITLSMQDISELDSESKFALLNSHREDITVEELDENGRVKREKVLNPNIRTFSERQAREIEEYKKRGLKADPKFLEKVNDLFYLEQDLKNFINNDVFLMQNPRALLSIAAHYRQNTQAALARKKYEYLGDNDSEINSSYEKFREAVLEALTDAKDVTEEEAIKEQAKKSSFYKQFAAESEIHDKFAIKVKNSKTYQKASSRLQKDVAALFNTIYKKGTIIDLDNYTAGTLESAISNLSKEEIETNWKRETDNSYQMADLGAAITLAIHAFNEALDDHRKEKERTEPIHVENVTPEQSTPKKSETPVVEGPIVEHSKVNPTVVLSIEDFLNKGATPAMKAFFEKHKVLDNIIRLINTGKLTTMNPVTRFPTQVYFTVDQIGKSNEIIQIVEDENGTYIVDGKKYSIIGIETAARAFTSAERNSDNIGKLLERTASVARIDTQRKTGEATNLQDVDNPETVLSNLTIGERKDSKIPKTEMVYNTKTGKGGTVYTSSVSDTAVDQVPISEGQTAIDILNSFRSLSEGERTALAVQFLEKLDYGTSKYVSKEITEAIANQNWDTEDFSKLMQTINSRFSSLYVTGRVAGDAAQFELTKTENGFTMKLVHPLHKNVSLSTIEREVTSEQMDIKTVTEMLLSTLAQAALTEDGKVQKFGKKPFLRFEIGLQDLEVVNRKTPLNVKKEKELRAAKKKIMMDRIELGILQLPNNDSVLHPKSIELVFNSDGKAKSADQVVPTPNADFTESRSNTVETTDGEIVDVNTGIVVESNVEKPKVTDIFEQATDEINDEAVVSPKTVTEETPTETPTEEDEEEISSDDINSSMSQDDEFGTLYQIDRGQRSRDMRTLIFWHTNHPAVQAVREAYQSTIDKINHKVKQRAVRIMPKESIQGAEFRMKQEVYNAAGEYANMIKDIKYKKIGDKVYAEVTYYSQDAIVAAIVGDFYKEFNDEQLHRIVEDLNERLEDNGEVKYQLNNPDKNNTYSSKSTGDFYPELEKAIEHVYGTLKTHSLTKSRYATPISEKTEFVNPNKVSIEEAKDVLGDIFILLDNPTEVIEGVVQDSLSALVDKYMTQPANKDLSKKLRRILKKYHIDVFEGPLNEIFGNDVKGAFSFIHKLVLLAEQKSQNALTEPEEFSHAFFALMGQSSGALSDDIAYHYKQLSEDIQKTSLYKQVRKNYAEVYGENTQKYIDEALAKALGAMLLKRQEEKSKEDKSFFAKLKEFFNKVLDLFRSKKYTISYSPYSSLSDELQRIADSILDGSYRDNYIERYTKNIKEINKTKVNALKVLKEQTKKDGGRTAKIISLIQKLGGTLSGSLALSRRGSIYREKVDLHDLDFSMGPEAYAQFGIDPVRMRVMSPQNFYEYVIYSDLMASIWTIFPGFRTMFTYRTDKGAVVHAFVSDSEEVTNKFIQAPGTMAERLDYLSDEEREQISLIDLFLNYKEQETIMDPVLGRISTEKYPFLAKASYGRLKDISDYQRFKSNLSIRKKIDNLKKDIGSKSILGKEEARLQKKTQVESLNSSPNALIESWEWLTEEARSRFEKKGITQEVWENMTSEEREKAIECI